MSEIVEVMARGAATNWEALSDIGQAEYRREASAALSALEAAGFAVVPKEPTEAMLKAGEEAPAWQDNATAICWAAMLTAAKEGA